MEVNRTLILTHLRKAEPRNLRNCTRLWQLSDPVFASGEPFSRKLSLVEEGGRLPVSAKFSLVEDRVFSRSGALDDPTPSFLMEEHGVENISASRLGYTDPGNNTFVLGGGNLNFCLFRTFASLAKIKLAQNNSLNALIPLVMVYCSERLSGPIDYALTGNDYSRFLEKTVPNYRITVDGALWREKAGPGPRINLHWFIVLRNMLSSPFFPEVENGAVLDRIMKNFSLKS